MPTLRDGNFIAIVWSILQLRNGRGPRRGGDGALGVVRVDQPLVVVNGPADPMTPLTVTVTQIWPGLAAGAALFRARML